jgi:class 3 adenylate cyclase
MAQLDARRRAQLPNRAFAYVDSRGRKRLPIHDEAHVRNALARFNQARFEDEAARDRARIRLLGAARKYGIVPVGFMTGQIQAQTNEATAGRLVIELARIGAPGTLERELRRALADPSLIVLQWSESTEAYLDGSEQPVMLPATEEGRAVTLLERRGRPMTALVHDPSVLKNPRLVTTVTTAVRLCIENEQLQGEAEARASEIRSLPAGLVTFLMSDIEGSTGLLHRLGDRYARLLSDVRRILRTATRHGDGREIDARADEFFAVFDRAGNALEAARSIQQTMNRRAWPDGASVRLRIGIHSGRPRLTDTGYVGLAVHAAARVCSAGHGGQILVSGAAVRAVGGSVADVGLLDLGMHQLRGLPNRLALYQLEAEGLPTKFPPLSTPGGGAPLA